MRPNLWSQPQQQNSKAASKPPPQVQKIWAAENKSSNSKPQQRMSQPPQNRVHTQQQQQQQQNSQPGNAMGISLLGENPMIQPSRNENKYSVPTFMKRVDNRAQPQQMMPQDQFRMQNQQQNNQQMMRQQPVPPQQQQQQFMHQRGGMPPQMHQVPRPQGRGPPQQQQFMPAHMVQGPNGPMMVQQRGPPQPMLFHHANQQNVMHPNARQMHPPNQNGKPPNPGPPQHVQMRQQQPPQMNPQMNPQMMMVPGRPGMNGMQMNPQQQAVMQQVVFQQQMIIAQQQAMMHQQRKHKQHAAPQPGKKKQPMQVKDIDMSAVQEFKPKSVIEAEKKNEEPKRADVGEWPNLPWEDKNGMNPKERYILQCSPMQFRWLSDPKEPAKESIGEALYPAVS